ncbi:unnamed protein product [Mycena citricolor]|uniref:CxC1-like cysteine cluster associated with KDZ transposases domain-containing protein n=1 Tax=Mycena citricolor TaxID=2018698 RepID=A0AAD2HBZ1_9AGAR|nr:unnamed protein product [Mycena citricolor]
MSRRRGLSKRSHVEYGPGFGGIARKAKNLPINKTSKQLSDARQAFEEQLQALSYIQREEIMAPSSSTQDVDMDYGGGVGVGDGDWEDDEVFYHTLPPGEEGAWTSAGDEDVWTKVADGMRPGRGDPRIRSHRVQQMINAWNLHMNELVDSYLIWAESRSQSGVGGESSEVGSGTGSVWPLRVLGFDVSTTLLFTHAPGASSPNEALLRRGYIGGSPDSPTIAFSTRTFEIYRQIHRVTPRFTVDSLARVLNYLHQVPRRRYLQEQLTTAYDAYLEILRKVDDRIAATLNRDAEWEVRNVCPPCFYKLEAEPKLRYSSFMSVDGNMSLKLVDTTFRAGNPRFDARQSASWRWLTTAQVDLFKDEVKNSEARKSKPKLGQPGTAKPSVTNDSSANGDHASNQQSPTDEADEDIAWLSLNELDEADIQKLEESANVCVERWKAAGPEARKKMFALFAVSGIFLAVCRHGHVLIMCDMIRSGELMKYPLAIVKHLMDTYGADIGLGYDIMCAFFKTLLRSSLGGRVVAMRLRGIVPAFHGHAHNRECQLGWHPMYIEGVGLEDFEECERTFCQSNHLASCTRLATPFHRQQQIDEHFLFHDLDKHASSGSFIFENYRQAVEKITDHRVRLAELERVLKTRAIDYESDLQAEREYLKSLKEEPASVTVAVDYLELLSKLHDAAAASAAAAQDFANLDRLIIESGITKQKIANIRTRYRTTHSRHLLVEEEVSRFELDHGIEQRWDRDSEAYREALVTLSERRYRRALDKLERLVVQRLLELTKLSMSGLGYKLREKIGKALRTRAEAIQSAITEYNAAAKLLNPPREELQWAKVVQTATLAEFDLLRNTRLDIRTLPWTAPSRREAGALYFGIKRAEEEIQRLNVEIRRLITFLLDEHVDFSCAITRNLSSNSPLASELSRRLEGKSRISASIVERLIKASRLPGFSGSLLPGDRLGRDPSLLQSCPMPDWAQNLLGLQQVVIELEEENDAAEIARELQGIDDERVVDLMDHLQLTTLDDNM